MEKNLESFTDVPTIDLSLLHRGSLSKSLVIKKIGEACRRYGFFQVVNHGVADSVMEEALKVNSKFFEMPMAAKEELMSGDIFKEVRFGKVKVGDFSRDFLKFYAHPLDRFLASWPKFPLDYREKMGMYSIEVRKLCIELFGAILESLNINKTHDLKLKFEQGFQIMGVNCYPSCSESNTKTGIPPHTDHSIITVLLQSSPGLQVIDNGSWRNVDPELKGSLQVFVGDHLEVISNGLYKSVLHRAVPGCNETRLSIANLHSLEMDEIVEPVAELEGEGTMRRYRGSSLRDFLNHLASGEKRAFIDTLKTDQASS